MKTLKRILAGVLVLIVLFVIAGFFLLNYIKKAAIPDYSKDIKLSGITEEVNVWRDSLGIPHVYAGNESDLYRAVGFTMAQDRLWQMDLLQAGNTGKAFGDFRKKNGRN